MKEVGRVLLDLRGLVLHSYYGSAGGADKVRDEEGVLRPTAISGMDDFIRRYLLPILGQTAPVNIIGVLEGMNGNVRRRTLFGQYKEKAGQDDGSKIVTAEKDKLLSAVQKLLLGLGAVLVKTPCAEADDTIAYLCKNLKGGKLVYTMDGDLLQLVRPGIAVMQKGEYKEVYRTKDVEVPLQPYNLVALFKSIVGDSSDGYPGVKGLGPKAWLALCDKYGYDGMAELEKCVSFSNFDDIAEALKDNHSPELEKLYNARDEWASSYRLAILHPEWCELSFQDKVIAPIWGKRVPSEKRLLDVLEPMGLTHHCDAFKRFMPRTWLYDKPYSLTQDNTKLFAAMRESRFVAFDYESYDKLKHEGFRKAKPGYVDVLNQVMTGCSFAFGSNFQYCFYMTTKHRDTKNVAPDLVKGVLMSMGEQTLIAHNSMFEQVVTYTNFDGLKLPNILDTVIMSSYVDENLTAGLKFLSKHWLNYDQTKYSDVVKHDQDMRDISGPEVLQYGCDDSIVTAHLAVLFNIIMECEGTWDFYAQNEPYFEKAMLTSFVRGVTLDYERLDELKKEDDELYKATYDELRQMLEVNCANINDDGYATLWAEIEPFERAKLEETERKKVEAARAEMTVIDVSTLEAVASKWEANTVKRLEEKRKKLYLLCKYSSIQAPTFGTIKSDIAKIGKCLKLPAIRSIKADWINTYCTGITAQVEAGAEINDKQSYFLDTLKAAAVDRDMIAVDALEAWMNNYAQGDETLWNGDQLNAGSPDQMAQLFYGKMGLPVLLRNFSKTGTDRRSLFSLEGAPSTNENAIRTWLINLKEESWQYKVLMSVLTIRGIRTRRSLYYVPYPLWQSPVDGMTHPQIRNCGTVTRRPSGTSYNIFQVSKTKDDGKIRSVFIPRSDNELIVSIDFVQQELVIIAGESGDANLRACYTGDERKDVHTLTGWKIYNAQSPGQAPITYEAYAALVQAKDKKASDIRKKYAKNTNFLEVFGGGPQGMARKIIVPLAMAEQFDASFHSAYPGIKPYQERRASEARRFGRVRSCFGTVRHLPDIHSKNKKKSSAAGRQAGNFPVQGGAADVLKKVMRGYVIKQIEERFGSTILGPVYDEIVASVPKEHIFNYVNELADIMEIALPGLDITLSTSVSIGRNWGQQIELGTRPSKELVQNTITEIEGE